MARPSTLLPYPLYVDNVSGRVDNMTSIWPIIVVVVPCLLWLVMKSLDYLEEDG